MLPRRGFLGMLLGVPLVPATTPPAAAVTNQTVKVRYVVELSAPDLARQVSADCSAKAT